MKRSGPGDRGRCGKMVCQSPDATRRGPKSSGTAPAQVPVGWELQPELSYSWQAIYWLHRVSTVSLELLQVGWAEKGSLK